MRKFMNTLSNELFEVVNETTENITLKSTVNNETKTIKLNTLRRWYVEKSSERTTIEVGTREIEVTRDNVTEIENQYGLSNLLLPTEIQVDTEVETIEEVNEVEPTPVTSITIIKLNVTELNEAKKKKQIEYNINDNQVSIIEYTEGQWKGWITGVYVNGIRFKNIKKAFQSMNLENEIENFKRFRIETRG